MRDMTWADWVRVQRKRRLLTRRKFASLVGVDPSYVTLMERDGTVPSRLVVENIGRLFGSVEEATVMASYVPHGCRRILVDAIVENKVCQFSNPVRQVIDMLAHQSTRKQLSAIRVLRAHLGASSEMTGEPVT